MAVLGAQGQVLYRSQLPTTYRPSPDQIPTDNEPPIPFKTFPASRQPAHSLFYLVSLLAVSVPLAGLRIQGLPSHHSDTRVLLLAALSCCDYCFWGACGFASTSASGATLLLGDGLVIYSFGCSLQGGWVLTTLLGERDLRCLILLLWTFSLAVYHTDIHTDIRAIQHNTTQYNTTHCSNNVSQKAKADIVD